MVPHTTSPFTWLQCVSRKSVLYAQQSNLRVVIVFAASIGGCGFPVVAKKVKWMKIPPKVFFFCKHFGTGVLIATAFVHVRLSSGSLNVSDTYSFSLQLSNLSTTHVFPSCSLTSTLRYLVSL